jgi:tetratricopeptide (TPR) repeat protein
MLVTLPLVLLLLDYWPLRRFSPASAGRLVREKLPLLALSVVFCVMAVSSPSGSQQGDPHDRRFDAAWRAKNVPLAYASYLGSFVYPVGLELPYPRSGPELPLGKVLAAALVPLLLTSAALILWRRRPYFAVGWLWYLVMLAPVSGLLQFDMHATTMTGDRFTYLPQIGLGIALSWGLADALRWATARRWLCAAAAALVVAVLMGAAWRQTSFWRDDETLWKHSLACTARNPMALHALGVALLDRGQVFQAIEQFRAALTVDPDQPSTLSHYYLGVALAGVGRLDEAIGEYQQAVRFQPYDAAAHNNLGQALLIRGRIAEGLALCQEALRLEPELAEAHYNVGNVFYVRGRVDEAIAEYQKAVKAKPGYAPAHYHLGLALAQRGKLDEAIAEYRQALTVDPAVDPEANPDFSAAEVHNALGRALAARGRTAEAAGHFRAALALRPDFAEAQRNLDRATSSQ